MSREKQIEEMAKDLRKSEFWYFDDTDCDFELERKKTAENLYNAGYRKASEVAEEIFEEIDRMIYKVLNDRHYIMGDMCYEVAELKNKYTESGRDKIAEFGKYSPLSWKNTEDK